MPLVQVVHSIQAVTATVPFSMIMLLDHMKRKALPADMRVRMIFPTNGLQSTSIWDVPDLEELQAWLDEYLGDDCINTICEVQEDFAWGIAAALGTARGTEAVSAQAAKAAKTVGQKASVVAGNTAAKIGELDEKYGVSKQATETFSTAKEKTGAAYAGASKSIGEMSSKAMENERVAKTVTTVGSYGSAAWRKLGTGVGFLKSKIAEVSETVAQSVQEYNNSETIYGDSNVETHALSAGISDAVPQEQQAAPAEPTFKGFDDEGAAVMEAPEPPAAAAAAATPPAETKAPAPPAPTPPPPPPAAAAPPVVAPAAEEQQQPPASRYTIEEDDSLDADADVDSDLAAIRLSEDGDEAPAEVAAVVPAAPALADAAAADEVQDELSAFIDAEEMEAVEEL